MLSDENVRLLTELSSTGANVIVNFYQGGEVTVSNSKYHFENLENNGAQAIGDHSSAVYNNQGGKELEDITKLLIEEILKNKDLPKDSQEEITGTISAINEQVESEKPNKNIIGSLYKSVESVISLAVKSPALIVAFDKWKTFLQPFIG